MHVNNLNDQFMVENNPEAKKDSRTTAKVFLSKRCMLTEAQMSYTNFARNICRSNTYSATHARHVQNLMQIFIKKSAIEVRFQRV